jgi:hypothetical protein
MIAKLPKWAIASFIGLGILVLLWWWTPDPRMHQANLAIRKVEAFQRNNGRLPNSLQEIGIAEDESGPVYYQMQDDHSYIIWFGLRLGESEVYNSRTHQWSED